MFRRKKTWVSIVSGMAIGGVVGLAAKGICCMIPRRNRMLRRAEKTLRLAGAMFSQLTGLF